MPPGAGPSVQARASVGIGTPTIRWMLAPLATHPWAYPALEVVHILGLALLLGNLALLELRAFGLNAALPLPALARATFALMAAGFVLVVGSGLTMFATQPADLLANRAFAWKMGLLTALATNAALFHARGGLARLDGWARLQLAASAGLWIATLAAGRWIAYV